MATRASEPWEGQTFADQKTTLSWSLPISLQPSWQLRHPEKWVSSLVWIICSHLLLFRQVVAMFPFGTDPSVCLLK